MESLAELKSKVDINLALDLNSVKVICKPTSLLELTFLKHFIGIKNIKMLLYVIWLPPLPPFQIVGSLTENPSFLIFYLLFGISSFIFLYILLLAVPNFLQLYWSINLI